MRSGYVTAALIMSAALVILLGLWPSSSLKLALDAALALR
jgi:NADH-quinone oxidoreductase subunit N